MVTPEHPALPRVFTEHLPVHRISAAAAVAMAKKWIIDLRRVRCRDSDKGQEANTRSAIKAASKIRCAGAEGGMRRQKGGVVKEMSGVPDTHRWVRRQNGRKKH